MIARARFVVSAEAPPVENGALWIDAGRLRAVGPYLHVRKHAPADRDERDFGDAVILPGLVNTHTHLELSDLAGRLTVTHDFTAWLRQLMALLSAAPRDEETMTMAVRAGIRQSLAAGVTTLGDITRHPAWSRAALATSPLRAVSFGEVVAIGSRRAWLPLRLAAALAAPPSHTPRLRLGLSPHAPYTLEPSALHECLRAARDRRLPLCMHLAEVADEEEFTRRLRGSLADYLRDLNFWDDHIQPHGDRPVALLEHYEFPRESTLLAHVNYATDADIDTLARRRVSVAYCPRTHAAFGHPPHRFRDMLAAGVNVCLGTDSLASNPSLSILDEMRFLYTRFPDLSPDVLLRLGTVHGARALGWADEVGSLTPGKSADFIVVLLPREETPTDWTSILRSTDSPVHVYVGGVEITSRGDDPLCPDGRS